MSGQRAGTRRSIFMLTPPRRGEIFARNPLGGEADAVGADVLVGYEHVARVRAGDNLLEQEVWPA